MTSNLGLLYHQDESLDKRLPKEASCVSIEVNISNYSQRQIRPLSVLEAKMDNLLLT